MSFTLLNDARACEDLAEYDLGHGTSVIISILFLLKHDLMCLASSKLRAIDLAQDPKGASTLHYFQILSSRLNLHNVFEQ